MMIRCGNARTPVLFLQGSPGYMVARPRSGAGSARYGADMVRACSCLEVPKVTYVIGPDHGRPITGCAAAPSNHASPSPTCAAGRRSCPARQRVSSGDRRRKNITDKGAW